MVKNNNTIQKHVYNQIKFKILNLGYKPGEYITEAQISNSLSVSRTPIREAFRMLETEGLLIYEPRRGWKVYSLSLQDINNIFEIKISLEAFIVKKASQCEDKELQRKLGGLIKKMRKAMEENNTNSWAKLDINLHHVIFVMADNDRVMNIIENLNDQWNRLRIGFSARTGRMARSIIEHEAIVYAILSGDADKSEKEMVAHLENVREELVNLLVNMVLPFVKEGV